MTVLKHMATGSLLALEGSLGYVVIQGNRIEEDRSLDNSSGTIEADVRQHHMAPVRRNSVMRTRDDHRWQTNGNTSQERVEINDEAIRESGVTIPIWRLYQLFWLIICLFFPLAALVSKQD